ncbi:MAG: UDP-N-acetylmuramoyl-L-alanine--D-glutamate ligase [Clostridiales bacterium]|nr:UDP-N-acetylmuramoyl-L-alanine--D-glutamate ligase [Clostridiales bacterium]
MSDIVIYGKGKTGQSLLKMLQKLGKEAVLYDDTTGFNGSGQFDSDNLVIVSPGVPPKARGLQLARECGAKIVGELEFCFQYCKGRCISVTGTNGKTTTCEMIYHALKCNGVETRLLGNGGTPFSSQVLEIEEGETVVLESSSFQLKDCVRFAPYVSLFTNLASDHLNYHGSLEEYAAAKTKNFINQRYGVAIFNKDDTNVEKIAEKCVCQKMFYSLDKIDANCYFDGRNVVVKDGEISLAVAAEYLTEFAKHNLSNALGAILACYCVGVEPEKAIEALKSYQLLPHRLQKVGKINEITFIDDSKATNVHATVSALSCYSETLALILGGSDKGESYDAIFDNMKDNVILVVAVGETAEAVRQCGAKYGVDVLVFDDFKDAVIFCYERLKNAPGLIIMSNACASFDKFSSYEERGNYFQKAVRDIQSGKESN